MFFIGQVTLDPRVFGNIEGRMAYLFMSDGDDYLDGTWEPDGGENAVIIQPGEPIAPVQSIVDGPSLYRMVPRPGRDRLIAEPCEFAVRLVMSEDPDFLAERDRWKLDEESRRRYHEAVDGNKVGGTPGFMQGDEFPSDDYRKLLLQLDATRVPFFINFGDCGIGFAFLSNNGRSGKFLWQCA
jgi:hypothetical protein